MAQIRGARIGHERLRLFALVVGTVALWGAANGCRRAESHEPRTTLGTGDDEGMLMAKQPPRDEPEGWEFQARQAAFVTGRPDLSAPAGAESDAAVASTADPYFTSVGLRRSDAIGLLVAMGSEGLLMRFTLKGPAVARLLGDKRRLRETPSQLLRMIYSRQEVEVKGPRAGETAVVGMSQLLQYPFVRLAWWPISPDSVRRMVAYEGRLKWRSNEAQPGWRYYLFVDKAKGLVYLLGW